MNKKKAKIQTFPILYVFKMAAAAMFFFGPSLKTNQVEKRSRPRPEGCRIRQYPQQYRISFQYHDITILDSWFDVYDIISLFDNHKLLFRPHPGEIEIRTYPSGGRGTQFRCKTELLALTDRNRAKQTLFCVGSLSVSESWSMAVLFFHHRWWKIPPAEFREGGKILGEDGKNVKILSKCCKNHHKLHL